MSILSLLAVKSWRLLNRHFLYKHSNCYYFSGNNDFDNNNNDTWSKGHFNLDKSFITVRQEVFSLP